MIKALWTLVKISVVIGLVVWIAERPGSISIDWMEYKLTFHVGFFLLIMLGIVVLGIFIFSIIKTVLDLPKNMKRYGDITNKDKGLRALTIGLTAVAAGDAKAASYQAQRAQRYLQEDEALPKLLEAQAARLRGDDMMAARNFIALLDNKDASFLGVRGLLQSALDSGDYEGALELGYKALAPYPKQPWILQIVYDLEIKLRDWAAASKILYRTEKAGAISSEKANSDRVAMLLAQADRAVVHGDEEELYRSLNKAYKVDKNFIPTVLRLAKMYLDRGKRKAALSMIEAAWIVQPHPGLAALWSEACPKYKDDDIMARVQWFEKLLAFKPDSVEGILALAEIMIQANLWGGAKKHLENAQEIRPNVNLYKLWAKLEERAGGDDMAVRKWLEKAADAPKERVWICRETGRVYNEWVPICEQGMFNTIIWDFPQGHLIHTASISTPSVSSTLLEAPKT